MDRHKRRYGLRRRCNGWRFLWLGIHQRFLRGFRRRDVWLVVRQNARQEANDQGKYQQESKEAFMDFYFRLKQLLSKTKKAPASIKKTDTGAGKNIYMISRGLLFSWRMQKSPGLLTYQDQQTGASNFVNIDFTDLCHIFLSTWRFMAYKVQNVEKLRFKSPLLPDQSIWHLCLPTKKSGLKKPGNG